MPRPRLAAPLTASFAVAALALAACGSDSSSGSATTASAVATIAATTTTAGGGYDDLYGGGGASTTAAPAAGGSTVSVGETSLGSVLVNADGLTLYLFTNDSPNTTTCTGDCLVAWPALTASGAPSAGEGVDASMLGTITRPDGATQVTYGGWPLYVYARDAAAGDVTGQGVGGVWFAVLPSGEAAP